MPSGTDDERKLMLDRIAFLENANAGLAEELAHSNVKLDVNSPGLCSMRRREDLEAVKAFIAWAQEKGLSIESLSCGDVTVHLREEQVFQPVVIHGEPINPDEDDEDDGPPVRDEDGRRMGPPPNVYAAMARELKVQR